MDQILAPEKPEVQALLERMRAAQERMKRERKHSSHVSPIKIVNGKLALVYIESPCAIAPYLSMMWARARKEEAVIVANGGSNGHVSFAVRLTKAGTTDIPMMLKQLVKKHEGLAQKLEAGYTRHSIGLVDAVVSDEVWGEFVEALGVTVKQLKQKLVWSMGKQVDRALKGGGESRWRPIRKGGSTSDLPSPQVEPREVDAQRIVRLWEEEKARLAVKPLAEPETVV